jgi:hypothetical protein
MPKFLFIGELKKLTNDARVLYSLLRDRHDLSIKNNWIDDKGKVYLIFSRENMCDILGVSDKTVTKAINTLKKFRLIEEERLGQGKPNKIYLLTVGSIENTKTRSFSDSKTGEYPDLESENFRAIKTDQSDTDSHRQQTPGLKTCGLQTEVVVDAPVKQSEKARETAPEVSVSAFAVEQDIDKSSILQTTVNGVETICTAYNKTRRQKGVDNLADEKTSCGQLSPSIEGRVVNRSDIFKRRGISCEEIERLELERLKRSIEKREDSDNPESSVELQTVSVKLETKVDVAAAVKKSKPLNNVAQDVCCLSFITELSDRDKISILKAADNDVETIRTAYKTAGIQGGIDNLTGWIIHMTGVMQRGEASPNVKMGRQTVNRFVNFKQRDIDFEKLERLELEQQMRSFKNYEEKRRISDDEQG